MRLKKYKSLFKEARKPFSKGVKVYIISLYDYNTNIDVIGKWFDLTKFRDAKDLTWAIEKWLDSLTRKSRDGGIRREWVVRESEFPQIIKKGSGIEDIKRFYEVKKIAEEQNIPEDIVIAYIERNRGEDGLNQLIFVGDSEEDYVREFLSGFVGRVNKENIRPYIDFDDFYINHLAYELADKDIEAGSPEDLDTLVNRYKKEIEKDPLSYHVDVLGYDMEDLTEVARIDYKKYWEHLSYDYFSFYSKETKKVYIFSRFVV